MAFILYPLSRFHPAAAGQLFPAARVFTPVPLSLASFFLSSFFSFGFLLEIINTVKWGGREEIHSEVEGRWCIEPSCIVKGKRKKKKEEEKRVREKKEGRKICLAAFLYLEVFHRSQSSSLSSSAPLPLARQLVLSSSVRTLLRAYVLPSWRLPYCVLAAV